MKGYLVYSWNGSYEQYGEFDKKYFIDESMARTYEKTLVDKEEKVSGWESGVCFEEIEIVEEVIFHTKKTIKYMQHNSPGEDEWELSLDTVMGITFHATMESAYWPIAIIDGDTIYDEEAIRKYWHEHNF